MHHQPDGAAFDLVLLLHAGCALVGLVTMAAAAASAHRLRRSIDSGLPVSEELRRYFRPGFNWAGRAVYGIPVFGLALVAMSQGSYALGEAWVLAGVGLFAGVVLLAEGTVWPAERRLQSALAAGARSSEPGLPAEGGADGPDAAEPASLVRQALVMARAASVVLVLLVLGIVLMVAQP